MANNQEAKPFSPYQEEEDKIGDLRESLFEAKRDLANKKQKEKEETRIKKTIEKHRELIRRLEIQIKTNVSFSVLGLAKRDYNQSVTDLLKRNNIELNEDKINTKEGFWLGYWLGREHGKDDVYANIITGIAKGKDRLEDLFPEWQKT